jgi:hypothetical protein
VACVVREKIVRLAIVIVIDNEAMAIDNIVDLSIHHNFFA